MTVRKRMLWLAAPGRGHAGTMTTSAINIGTPVKDTYDLESRQRKRRPGFCRNIPQRRSEQEKHDDP